MENNNQGGGIPDEVRVEKAYQLLKKRAKESYLSHGSFSASPFGLDGIPYVKYDAISKLMVEFSDSELSLASEKLKEKDEEISRLKEENERLRGEVETVIRWNESWPLRDILNELVQASEILLDKKNYDGHGWEEIRHAMNHAKVIVSHLTPSPTTKK